MIAFRKKKPVCWRTLSTLLGFLPFLSRGYIFVFIIMVLYKTPGNSVSGMNDEGVFLIFL
jgi:hypothetical protein